VSERDAFGNPIDSGQAQAPPPPPPLTPARASDLETQGWIALGCGVGGVFLFPVVLSIAAILLGRRPRRELPAGAPRSAATAGYWIGIVTIVFWVLAIAFFITLFIVTWDTNDF
jgi:hypothetical protein